jgi:hypothetical protein
VLDALENAGYKKLFLLWHRRSGKDVVAFNVMIRAAIRKKAGVYFYCLPTYSHARKVIWDGILSSGMKFLDFIPPELIANKNGQEMKITLVNGSLIQLVGSDTAQQSLVGTNPQGVVFSEWALAEPSAYQFIRPALLYNDGWAIFVTTPRGRNHAYEMHEVAKNSSDWFCSVKTINDTGVISMEEINKERLTMSQDLIDQEYFVSYTAGVEGSYYCKYIDKMRLNGQIGIVPWEPQFKVWSAWDLGVHDKTIIIMWQQVGTVVRIIDMIEGCDKGLDTYAKLLREKPYNWGGHFAPHDIKVRELSTGLSRLELARRMGIDFKVLPNLPIEDGIELCRVNFPKVWIDERNCSNLIKALESYRRQWDDKHKVYREGALHDDSSHYCFIGETLIRTPGGQTPIKDIQVGDYVLTPLGKRKVLAVHKKLTNSTLLIETGSGDFECTSDHEIFTQNGREGSDALRYTSVLEKYGKLRNYVWKKLIGSLSKGLDTEGFKTTILSLRMRCGSCLMGSVLAGMDFIIRVGAKDLLRSNEQCGSIITELYQRVVTSTIRMKIEKIMQSRTLNVLIDPSIRACICLKRVLGRSLRHVKICFIHLVQKQPNGMVAQKEMHGIKSMPQAASQYLREQNISKHVKVVEKNSQVGIGGQSFALTLVRRRIGRSLRGTLLIVIAVYVKLYSVVINTLLRRHVVKSVCVKRCEEPKEVYDLTVELDHCYYAYGYLVSNCDAYRYLNLALPRTQDGYSAADLRKSYEETVYGRTQNVHPVFADALSKY